MKSTGLLSDIGKTTTLARITAEKGIDTTAGEGLARDLNQVHRAEGDVSTGATAKATVGATVAAAGAEDAAPARKIAAKGTIATTTTTAAIETNEKGTGRIQKSVTTTRDATVRGMTMSGETANEKDGGIEIQIKSGVNIDAQRNAATAVTKLSLLRKIKTDFEISI